MKSSSGKLRPPGNSGEPGLSGWTESPQKLQVLELHTNQNPGMHPLDSYRHYRQSNGDTESSSLRSDARVPKITFNKDGKVIIEKNRLAEIRSNDQFYGLHSILKKSHYPILIDRKALNNTFEVQLPQMNIEEEFANATESVMDIIKLVSAADGLLQIAFEVLTFPCMTQKLEYFGRLKSVIFFIVLHVDLLSTNPSVVRSPQLFDICTRLIDFENYIYQIHLKAIQIKDGASKIRNKWSTILKRTKEFQPPPGKYVHNFYRKGALPKPTLYEEVKDFEKTKTYPARATFAYEASEINLLLNSCKSKKNISLKADHWGQPHRIYLKTLEYLVDHVANLTQNAAEPLYEASRSLLHPPFHNSMVQLRDNLKLLDTEAIAEPLIAFKLKKALHLLILRSARLQVLANEVCARFQLVYDSIVKVNQLYKNLWDGLHVKSESKITRICQNICNRTVSPKYIINMLDYRNIPAIITSFPVTYEVVVEICQIIEIAEYSERSIQDSDRPTSKNQETLLKALMG